MILVDTSVWITHFRVGNQRLVELLMQGEVSCHPFIVGELACGNLKNRTVILTHLHSLPLTISAAHDEVLFYIENHKLMGKGLGYVDMHLLTSAMLSNIPIWTEDEKLRKTAKIFNLNYL